MIKKMDIVDKKTVVSTYLMTLPMYINTISFSIMFLLMNFVTGFGQSQLTIYIIWVITILWSALFLKIVRWLGLLYNDQQYGWNFWFALLSQTVTNLFIFLAVSMSMSLIGNSSGLHPFDKLFYIFIYVFSLLIYLAQIVMDGNALERLFINNDVYLKVVPS